jgi:hypothetical protein
MGRHLIDKAGSIATVQRQLGHTNAAYSIQYTPGSLTRNWLRRWMIGSIAFFIQIFGAMPYYQPCLAAAC